MLDQVALFVIFFLAILLAAGIVWLGSIPGKIARGRNHPYPDAVNAASWIGMIAAPLWPLAFIWTFLTIPAKPSGGSGDSSNPNEDAVPSEDFADLPKRLTELETVIKQLQSQGKEKLA